MSMIGYVKFQERSTKYRRHALIWHGQGGNAMWWMCSTLGLTSWCQTNSSGNPRRLCDGLRDILSSTSPQSRVLVYEAVLRVLVKWCSRGGRDTMQENGVQLLGLDRVSVPIRLIVAGRPEETHQNKVRSCYDVPWKQKLWKQVLPSKLKL